MKTLFLIPIAITFGTASLYALAQTAVSYTSPIADYQLFVDEKISGWKAANDKVGQIGGWRAYAKEAQQPENTPALTPPPAAAPTSAPPATKIDPHAGHKQ